MDALAAVTGKVGVGAPLGNADKAASDAGPERSGGAARIASRVDAVEVGGRSMMLSRLFHGVPVSYGPGYSAASGTIYGFLTESDRDTVASLYDYAQGHGADLVQVDKIAFDLGVYRSSRVHSDTPATMYDEDGVLIPVAFSNDNERVARRLLTSKAVKDSALPEDFLRHELTPATGIAKAADFDFLEQVVYDTSRSKSGDATDPDAVLAPRSVEYFRSLQAASNELLTPDQVKRLAAGLPDSPPSIDDFAERIRGFAAMLNDDNKARLAALYQAISERHGQTSPHLRTVDEIARQLAAAHVVGAAR